MTRATPSAMPAVSTSEPAGPNCTATRGSLNLRAGVVRATGISPFLAFLDATGTTDSSLGGNSTAFQDVTYTWDFGDTGTSGTGTWAYGSNAGHNGKNKASGGVAAHLYLTAGADTVYTITVTANDGTNTASCQLRVTAYDPSGPKGFPRKATTCVSSSATPVAGGDGCPAGAATLNTSNFAVALGSSHFGSRKQVLFKCGDTFTGSDVTLTGATWSIGAYGGCQGTQRGRPIFRDTTAGAPVLKIHYTSGDGRISDIDCEGSGRVVSSCVSGTSDGPPPVHIPFQITLWNLNATGLESGYSFDQGAQWGLIQVVADGAAPSWINTFLNSSENNPGSWSGNPYNNLNYLAVIGSHITGAGCCGASAGVETLRISAGSYEVIENNTVQDANNVGAVLKLHSGNTYQSSPTWAGVYTQFVEISDNLFTGNSGANLVENAPQNANDDERLRYFVVERNIFAPASGATADGRELLLSAVNSSVRDNVFYIASGATNPPFAGVQIGQRSSAVGNPVPVNVEVYNNTCDFLATQSGQYCVGFDGNTMNAPANESYAKNNLLYSPAGNSTVRDGGIRNSISNNTSTTANDPSFANASATFGLITDFRPTANYSGGVSVPVLYDALGVAWFPTWDLGAVRH